LKASSRSCEGGFKFLENAKDLPTIGKYINQTQILLIIRLTLPEKSLS